jgi:hypothetical protein
MKISSNLLRACGTALTLSAACPAQAHHSFATYDIDNKIERRGTVTKFEFVQPHILMVLEAQRDDGSIETWEIESMAPRRWDSFGYPRDVAKVGDEITILGWPARDGTDKMVLSTIISQETTTVIIEQVRQRRARENLPEVTIKRQ